MNQHLTCAVFVLALASSVRVDDDEQDKPERHFGFNGQALNPDGSPKTIEEKAAAGQPAAVKALSDAKMALDLAGPIPAATVPKFELESKKAAEDLGQFFDNNKKEKDKGDLEFAEMKSKDAAAEASAAAAELQVAHQAAQRAKEKQEGATSELNKAEMMHDDATTSRNKADSVATGSAISAAASSKVLETSKSWKDTSEEQLKEKEQFAKSAKEKSDTAEASLEHVYALKASSGNDLETAESAASDAKENLVTAKLEYTKNHAIHAKVSGQVAGVLARAHSSAEAEAVATDKAFSATHEFETLKENAEKAAGKAKQMKEQSNSAKGASEEIEQAKKMQEAGAAAADNADA